MRKDGVYLLPACTQFETVGSRTASNRSIQWGEKVIEPLFESKPDHTIMYAFAKKFGFEKELCKNIKVLKDKQGWDEPEVEDILREINKGCWTIGYTGQSPERLKLHMKHMATFDVKTLQANGGPCDGEYFGLPWPCYGTPELKHSGHAQSLRHLQERHGRWRQLPRQLRRRARRGFAARCRRFGFEGCRPADGLSGIRPRAAQEAGLVGRPDRRREKAGARARTGRPTVPAAFSASS